MEVDNRLLELIEIHANSDPLGEFTEAFSSTQKDIDSYVEERNYTQQMKDIHICLYYNLSEEEYIWAEQCKIEIGKL